jgi:hypothetical protein
MEVRMNWFIDNWFWVKVLGALVGLVGAWTWMLCRGWFDEEEM